MLNNGPDLQVTIVTNTGLTANTDASGTYSFLIPASTNNLTATSEPRRERLLSQSFGTVYSEISNFVTVIPINFFKYRFTYFKQASF